MPQSPAQRALAASAVSLVIALACLATFIPPLLDRTTESVLRVVLIACTMSVAMLLHLVFLGIGARRMERSVAAWVALGLLLFPVGGAAALVLLSWLGDETPVLANGA